jgi:hypothetical protein
MSGNLSGAALAAPGYRVVNVAMYRNAIVADGALVTPETEGDRREVSLNLRLGRMMPDRLPDDPGRVDPPVVDPPVVDPPVVDPPVVGDPPLAGDPPGRDRPQIPDRNQPDGKTAADKAAELKAAEAKAAAEHPAAAAAVQQTGHSVAPMTSTDMPQPAQTVKGRPR